MKSNRNQPKIALSILLIALLSACSTPKPPEQAVKDRIEKRYAAIIDNDMKTAYGFLSPARREALDYEAFLRAYTPRVNIKKARVLKVECPTPDACEAEVELAYEYKKDVKAAPSGLISKVTPEKWIRQDGQWWYQPLR